ncbi:hypothetical protein [Helicobacter sp. 13S00477-4]|uniref:hypothetical protein n=1 Tax=Helicobacter sp. 13S00477-4 TaxID=1905759 RepID=UPI000BA7ADBE|nr:hypothetical protein [Helicobacter sp. 13S00477-4]PAF52783.1 hypothetical protein BKH44_00950 [Helicobacter sp. 13S00477-4]
MEEAILVLKKIGVKEISKTTKISMSKIEDILEKRFSNLQRVRVVGFLNILEREYKLDLSQWLEEYDENIFFDVNTYEQIPTVNNEGFGVGSLNFDTQKQKDDLIEQRKKQFVLKKRFYLSLIIVVIVLVGYFMYKSFFGNNQSKTTLSQNQALQINKEPKSDELSENTEGQQDFTSQKNQSEESMPPAEDSPQKIPNVSTQESLSSQITINPDKELWIEIIDLSNGQKSETITSKPYSIETGNNKLLISFGHGEFELREGNKVEHYSKSYPMRFLYTPNDGLTHIKYTQYLKLSNKNTQDIKDNAGGKD